MHGSCGTELDIRSARQTTVRRLSDTVQQQSTKTMFTEQSVQRTNEDRKDECGELRALT